MNVEVLMLASFGSLVCGLFFLPFLVKPIEKLSPRTKASVWKSSDFFSFTSHFNTSFNLFNFTSNSFLVNSLSKKNIFNLENPETISHNHHVRLHLGVSYQNTTPVLIHLLDIVKSMPHCILAVRLSTLIN